MHFLVDFSGRWHQACQWPAASLGCVGYCGCWVTWPRGSAPFTCWLLSSFQCQKSLSLHPNLAPQGSLSHLREAGCMWASHFSFLRGRHALFLDEQIQGTVEATTVRGTCFSQCHLWSCWQGVWTVIQEQPPRMPVFQRSTTLGLAPWCRLIVFPRTCPGSVQV